MLTQTLLVGCWRDGDILVSLGIHSPVTIRAVQPLASEPLGALILHDARDRFPCRVHYLSLGSSEGTLASWQSSDSAIVVLGLRPGERTSVENLLNNLPSAFADFGSNESNGSVGTATVNLRDLGCARTLVLIDGKRLMPGDNVLPCPDLNQIPAAMVDHVEVVTGGASAVYGSDAVAGVVNFIMRKDFEGIEFDGQYSVNQHNNDNSADRTMEQCGFVNSAGCQGGVRLAPSSVLDGATTDGTIVMGVNSDNGKGNITVYGGYRNIQPVLESQYDTSACATSANFGQTGFGFGCVLLKKL